MKVLTNAQIREADRRTIEGGTPGRELMRRAAQALFEAADIYAGSTYVICGKGNNGGDGYALACILREKGCRVKVFATDSPKGDAEFFAEEYKRGGGEVFPVENCDYECDTIVDCLFGSGFHGQADGVYKQAIERINASGAFVLSADMPSGLNGDSGRGGACVQADVTLAVQAARFGHFLGMGKDVCGRLEVADIGIDIGEAGADIVDEDFCAKLFPPRKNDSNKGTYGRCAVIGGSVNFPGAVKLADMGLSALQSGCGLCTIAAPAFLMPALASCVVENTLFPLKDDGKGICFDKEEADKLLRGLECVAIGPGIGANHHETGKFIKELAAREIKLIIDADGLNCLAQDLGAISGHRAQILLTPHPMEMARLCGSSLPEVLDSPVQTAVEFAKKHDVCVLLKGAATVITDGEKTALMKDGGPYLAKGGSGDVLTGVACGIAARGYSLFASAAAASYLCATAGADVCAQIGEYGTLPSAVARRIKQITDKYKNS